MLQADGEIGLRDWKNSMARFRVASYTIFMAPALGSPITASEERRFSTSAHYSVAVLILAGLFLPSDVNPASPEAEVLVILSFTGPIEITDKDKKVVIKGGAQASELRIPKGATIRVLDGEAVLMASRLVVKAGKGAVFEYAGAPQGAGQISLRTAPESASIKLTLDRTEMTLQADSQLRFDPAVGNQAGAVCDRGRVTVVIPDGSTRELGAGENLSFAPKTQEVDQPTFRESPAAFVERPFINGERGWVYPVNFSGTPPQCPYPCVPGDVLMKFVPSATQSQINELIGAYSLKQRNLIGGTNVYFFTADPVWFYRIIQLLQTHPLVQYAEPNFIDYLVFELEITAISPSSP